MNARLSLVFAASLGLAACQGDGANPSAASATNPAVASQENFLTIVSEPSLSVAQRGNLSRVRGRAGLTDTHLARITTSPAQLLREGGALRLAVAPGVQVAAIGERVEQRSADDISWSGPLIGGEGWVQMVYSPEGVTATVTVGRAQYAIQPLGNGLHAVSKIDQGAFPPEHTADNPSGVLDQPTAGPLSAKESTGGTVGIQALTTQTVLVVYTASAASAAGNISSLIQLAVDETNQSYVNSGINISMTRVHTAQVTYNEAGRSFSQHVTALRSTTDGLMDNVHTLRNTYAADVVMLVVNDSEACGQAAVINATSASNGFAVAHYSCITGYYSFGHEIGHLQGARHDRFVDGTLSPFQYGHGFIPASKAWRTIMSYGNNCSNCTRIQYWSSPLKTYGGVAMGTATYEDNARVLNTTALTIAGFK
jgi:hypothetical protein